MELSPTAFGQKARSTRRCGNRTTRGNATVSWPQRKSFWTTRPSTVPPLHTTTSGRQHREHPCLTFPCSSSHRHRLPHYLTVLCAQVASSSPPAPTTHLLRPPTRSTSHLIRRTTTRLHPLTWSSSLKPLRPTGTERRRVGLVPANHLRPHPLRVQFPAGPLRRALQEALRRAVPVVIERQAREKHFHHRRRLRKLVAQLCPALWTHLRLRCIRLAWTTEVRTAWNCPRRRRHPML